MNLREAIQLFQERGGTVDVKRRHGEYVCKHPNLTKPVLVNLRRKDATRALLVAIKRASQ